MIPKVIHYFWFGGNSKNEMIQKCIDSWKRACPEYEIKEWTEANYDVRKHPFMKAAYDAKKWAFVADYARIDVIHEYGGVYLDTDVELIKSLDAYLEYDFYAGFESASFVNFGIGFGAVKGHRVLKESLAYYDKLEFPATDFALSQISCPRIQTELLQRHGMVCNNQTQVFDDCHIFSTEFFCPMSFRTGKTNITENTVSIHHFDMSWNTKSFKRSKSIEWKMAEVFGEKWGHRLSSFINFPGKLMSHAKEGTLKDYLRFLMRRK